MDIKKPTRSRFFLSLKLKALFLKKNYSALIFAERRLFLRAAVFLLIKPLVA